ncbi:hypothetical protein [Ideonella sp.]|uniref:hypothetical protein n=1 Tax=Ideonella sp. TaxID=1929293 RepID=UPI002B47B565|nr:hypothetical protein [Ideonella sp.]HJV68267.1 hypothetical protein [Ideonella sp.]
MNKYRRPLLAIAAIVAVSTLMSACVVVPARGYYRYKYRYYGQLEVPATVVQAPSTAQA